MNEGKDVTARALILAAAASLLGACNQGSRGDGSLNVSGRAQNSAGGGVVKVLAVPGVSSASVAQGSLNADGSFQVTLPHESALGAYLMPAGVPPCAGVTVSPSSARGVSLQLAVYDSSSSSTTRAELVRLNQDPSSGTQTYPYKLGLYTYVDRDTTVKGQCTDSTGITTYDVNLRKGYNSIVFVRSSAGIAVGSDASDLRWYLVPAASGPARAETAPASFPFAR
jgi:hypothetical protein